MTSAYAVKTLCWDPSNRGSVLESSLVISSGFSWSDRTSCEESDNDVVKSERLGDDSLTVGVESTGISAGLLSVVPKHSETESLALLFPILMGVVML